MGKRLLRASRSIAGAAVRGDQGWRKLEERREAKKLIYGKRLEGLEDNRWIKIREAEGCWKCWMVGEYGTSQRKHVITEEDQARREWKAKVEEGNDQDLWEEVETLKRLAIIGESLWVAVWPKSSQAC